MSALLVLIRHAKSDWDTPVPDRDRPLAHRGRRQAPAVGQWLSARGIRVDDAVVSVATRARQTWELVAAELDDPPVASFVEAAYTFDGADLIELVAAAPPSGTMALVGHNPALEELVESLTGESVRMPTSAVALIDLDAGRRRGTLRWAGRPADLG